MDDEALRAGLSATATATAASMVTVCMALESSRRLVGIQECGSGSVGAAVRSTGFQNR